jgi:ABC-type amino acid transport substrate-binding protein
MVAPFRSGILVMKIKILSLTFLFTLLISLLATGCSPPVREKLTMETLKNKRVGVMCGYSSDYIFCQPEYKQYNLQLYRFDMYSDMELALHFNRLDVAAMENDEAYVFCRMMPEFKIGLVPAVDLEFGYPFNRQRREFLTQFNQWIKEFRKTDTYADIEKRVENTLYEPWVPKKVENLVTTDRVLKVAAFDGWEPVSYINTSTDEWEGSDVELITHFANSLGAKVEIIDKGYSQMLIELGSGLIDLMLTPETLLYQKDMELGNNVTMSDGVFLKSIVLLVNKEAP